jgi:hypothetical protein
VDVTVIAGGHAAGGLDLTRLPGIVIAVNDAAIYAPRIDIIVSMDRLWAEGRFAKVSQFGKPLWLRRRTLMNIEFKEHACVVAFENDHRATRLSDTPGILDGGHSGMCAINLAYHMRPQRLFLVGFDSGVGPRGERHWFPDYPWKGGGGSKAGTLAGWARQYDTAAAQLAAAGIDTYMHAPRSVRCFRTINRKALEAAWPVV